jgi:hypothetical protein
LALEVLVALLVELVDLLVVLIIVLLDFVVVLGSLVVLTGVKAGGLLLGNVGSATGVQLPPFPFGGCQGGGRDDEEVVVVGLTGIPGIHPGGGGGGTDQGLSLCLLHGGPAVELEEIHGGGASDEDG